MINGPEIMGKTAGESESNLRGAYAGPEKNSPVITFIDQTHSVCPKLHKSGVRRSVVLSGSC